MVHKKDPFGCPMQGYRARVKVWNPGGGQGRDSSGESTVWTWAGLWEGEEEVGEKDRNVSGPWD